MEQVNKLIQEEDFGKFRSYSAIELLEMKFKPREFLIESLAREKDSIIFVGNEKSGKSLFVLQLIASATSQHPFLDKFEVKNPCRVTYVQLEGEIEDTQDRLKRLLKTLECDSDLFQVLYSPPLELQNKEGINKLYEDITAFHKPDIIIIDPLYFAFSGSLSQDDIVRQFIGNLRILKEKLGCAIILVHHTHKKKWDNTGNKIDEGDEAIFGSVFFKAWADHILFLAYDKRTGVRTLSCTTQRSGNILKLCQLRLVEPDPLYFEESEGTPTRETQILNILMQEEQVNGLTADEFMKISEMGHTTFYKSVKKPLAEGVISKSTQRPVRYFYVKRKEQ